MRERFSRLGVSLGTVLLATAIVATLGIALAGSSILNLHLSRRVSNEAQAMNLARSVVAAAAEEVFSDETWGVSRAPEDSLDITFDGAWEGATGRLTFDLDRAQDWGIPHSTNNLEESETANAAEAQVIPAHTVHLVGVGECGGVVRRVDAILQRNHFAYAVASNAPVTSSGQLTVASVGAGGSTELEDLLPADLVSNAEGGTSVDLGADTLVTGDVQAPGSIILGDTAKVRGEVREGAAPVELPRLVLNEYDPEERGVSFEPLADADYEGTTITGAARRVGALNINGDLVLDGALLFVDGDLYVTGGVKGLGIMTATGSITVERAAELSGANKLALLAGGDISLGGTGPYGSYLQGLVYTQGSFHASQVTVIGSLVVDSAPTASVELENCRVLLKPESIEIEVVQGPTQMYFWYPEFRFDAEIDLESDPPSLVVTDPLPPEGRASWSNPVLQTHPEGPLGVLPLPSDLNIDDAALRSFLTQMMLLNSPSAPPNLVENYVNTHVSLYRSVAGGIDVGEPPPPESFSVNPSEFLKPNEASRLRQWKEQ